MRSISKNGFLLVLLSIAFVLASYNHADAQTTITVEISNPAINADSLCSMREAIVNANNDAQTHNDCPAVSGADTIDLNGLTVTFSDSYADYSGATALPSITSDITIENGTLDTTTQAYRYLHVASAGTLMLDNMTLRDGGETNIWGGAVYIDTGATVKILNSTLDNFIANRAGAIWSYGTLRVFGSTFSNNTVSFNGGAIVGNANSDALIVNSTFWGNFAQNKGGAVHNGHATAVTTLVNATVTVNSATVEGGGITRDGGQFHIQNSFISGNAAATADLSLQSCTGDFSTSTAHNNLFGRDSVNEGCTGFGTASNNLTPTVDIDAMVVLDGSDVPLLMNNGGSTETVALISGSPMIDLGDDNLLPDESTLGIDVNGDGDTNDPIEIDQRGSSRFIGTVDVGAYEGFCEAYTFPYTVGTAQSNLVDDIRQAMTCANSNGTDDTIDLNGQTVTFTDAPAAYDLNGFNSLPPITENLTIENGVIERDSNLSFYCGSTPNRDNFRLLVTNTSNIDMVIKKVTLRNGYGCGESGGAIYFFGSGNTLTLLDTHFEGNATTNFGSAIRAYANLTIVNSSFVNNSGVGILKLNSGATATIVNTTIANNGGRAIDGNGVTIINTTISGNSGATNGNLSAYNSILKDNGNSNYCGQLVTIVSSHSYSDDDSCDFSSNNGMDNATITLGSLTQAPNGTYYYSQLGGDPLDGGDNSLLPTESALGVDVDGDGTISTSAIDVDQRGANRISFSAIDAGAIEISCADYAFPYIVGTVQGILADDLRQAIDCANNNATQDTIDLNGQTVTFTDAPNDIGSSGLVALSTITSDVVLQNGTIERDSSYTTCANNDNPNDFRFFYNLSILTLKSMTIKNGCGTTVGGVVINNGNLNVIDAHFEANRAVSSGAAIFSGENAETLIINSSFVSNSGSTVLNFDAITGGGTIVNSTFTGNSASAIIADADYIINSTISRNTGTAVNGEYVYNSILSENTLSNCNTAFDPFISLSNTYSDNNSCNFGLGEVSQATIVLGSLTQASNGTYYLPLISGDPVNGGDNSLLPDETTLGIDIDSDSLVDDPIDSDQIGHLRVSIVNVDAGAHEASCDELSYVFPYTVGTVQNNLVDDLRNAIYCANENATDDTIDLNEQTVTFSDSYGDFSGETALPKITSTINLINGTLDSSVQDYRYLVVESGGILSLNAMTLQNGGSSSVSAGGGIFVGNGGTLKVNATTFDGITAQGGGALWSYGAVDIVNSTFSNNSATNGGAIFIGNNSDLRLVNSTLVSNHADDRGGALFTSPSGIAFTIISNTTITGNSADSDGGAIYTSASYQTDLFNNIISGNQSLNGNDECGGTQFNGSAFYNLFGISGASGGCTGFLVDNNNIIPIGDLSTIFETVGGVPVLANNGGTTQTIALAVGSPAINASNDSSLQHESTLSIDIDGDGNVDDPIDVDQRGAGFGRIFGYSVDAGSYEYRGVDINGDGIVSPEDAIFVVNRDAIDDLTADVDGDGDVDQSDIDAVMVQLGSTP